MRLRALATAAVVAAAAGCELSPRLYLTVRTESGSLVRRVEVRVFSPTESPTPLGTGAVEQAIDPARPLEMRVLGRAGGERVRVTVEGRDRDSDPIIRQEWVTSMPSQGAGYLQIVLWNACRDVTCPTGTTCSSIGTCIGNTVTPDPKGGSDGGAGLCPETGTGSCQSIGDATVRDAGAEDRPTVDAGGTDAGTMDVPMVDAPIRVDAPIADSPLVDAPIRVDAAPDTGDAGSPTDTPAVDATDATADAGRCPAWRPGTVANWTRCGTGSCPTLCGTGETCVDVERLVLGTDHGCALRADGRVSCWGERVEGRLGDDGADSGVTAVPVEVRRATPSGPLTSVVALAAGAGGTCAVDRDDALRCWGTFNADPVLTGFTPVLAATPARRLIREDAGAASNRFVGAATHLAFTCGIVRGGGVRCSSWVRALADGNLEVVDRPEDYPVTDITFPGGTPVEVGVGLYHGCSRMADGTVWCWGSNRYGQLGTGLAGTDGGVGASNVARQVPGVSGARSLGVGDFFACAATDRGVLCWGNAGLGRVGTFRGVLECPDANECMPTPVAVDGLSELGSFGPVVQVAAGSEQACVRFEGGQVYCWGYNDVGQIGLPTTGPGRIDMRAGVTGAPIFTDADDVVTGGSGGGGARSWTCARRRSDCTWWCWGRVPGEATPPADPERPRPLRWGP